MDMKLIGGAGNGNAKPGTEAVVDPLYGAPRVSLRPVDHQDGVGNNLGYYAVGIMSGATASIGAAGILASLRWTDPSRFLALLAIRAGYSVLTAVTAATPMDLGAYLSRGATAQATGGNTPTVGVNNMKARTTMGTSLVASGELRVASASAITRGTTGAADANPFAIANLPPKVSPDIGATAATGLAAGTGRDMQDLWRWDPTKHPIILAANEAIELQQITAGPVTGTVKWYFVFEWAELAAY